MEYNNELKKELNSITEISEIEQCERFFLGEYMGEPVEFQKLDDKTIMSVKVLDCVIFDPKSNDIDKAIINKWLRHFENVMGFPKKWARLPNMNDMTMFFAEFERRARPTDWAILHGVYSDEADFSPFWLDNEVEDWYTLVRTVNSSGQFYANYTDHSFIGVRPIVQIK